MTIRLFALVACMVVTTGPLSAQSVSPYVVAGAGLSSQAEPLRGGPYRHPALGGESLSWLAGGGIAVREGRAIFGAELSDASIEGAQRFRVPGGNADANVRVRMRFLTGTVHGRTVGNLRAMGGFGAAFLRRNEEWIETLQFPPRTAGPFRDEATRSEAAIVLGAEYVQRLGRHVSVVPAFRHYWIDGNVDSGGDWTLGSRVARMLVTVEVRR